MAKEEHINRDVLRDTISQYNDFCKEIKEGDILYNIDSTNLWGDYLVVASKAVFTLGTVKTYYMLLIGLDKESSNAFKTNNCRINLTPDKADNTSYLKRIGHCKFTVELKMDNVQTNKGLMCIYEGTDLLKYYSKIHMKKPRKKKYDRNGELTRKPLNNND